MFIFLKRQQSFSRLISIRMNSKKIKKESLIREDISMLKEVFLEVSQAGSNSDLSKDQLELLKVRNILEEASISCGRIHNPSVKMDPDYWRFL